MFRYRKLASNTLYQILARITSSGTSFVIAIFIARYFGVFGYGDYAKVTAIVSFFYLLADFGFNAIYLQKDDKSVSFKDLIYTRIILALLLIVVINIISFLLPYHPASGIGFSPGVKIGIFVFSFTILTEAILYSSSAIYQRKLTYVHLAIATFGGSIISLAALFFLITFHAPLWVIFFSFVIGGIVESGLSVFLTKENLLPFHVDIFFVKQMVKEVLPITLMLLFNLVYFRADIIILSFLKVSNDVGVYDFAYKFFDFFIALPLFLSNVLYPSLLQDEKILRIEKKKIMNYTGIFFLLGILIAIPVWIFAPLLSVVKSGFSLSVLPLRILILSLPIFFATSIAQWILIAKKKQVYLMLVYLLSTVANIFLNFLFIPQYGYIASAIITGVSELGVFLFLLIKLKRIS